MGRWSELRVLWVFHSTAVARWAEIRDRSGEVGTGRGWVGVGWFRRKRSLLFMAAAMVSPRVAARSHCVAENHASLWALKSPTIKVSASEEKKGSRVSSES